MFNINNLLQPQILIFLIPIIAILSYGIQRLVKMKFEHDERIAKIEAGQDPDTGESLNS